MGSKLKKSVGNEKANGTKTTGFPAERPPYQFILYIAGLSPKSRLAINNLRQICDQYLSPDGYAVEIVDLVREPKRARHDQILAVPTLVKKVPPPFKKIIGDLSNRDKVLMGLDIYDKSGRVIFSGSLKS